MIKISKRLKEIAELVDDNSRIVDIGCDHGLLDIYLIEKCPNLKIIATDIKESALDNAKKNISKFNYEDKIETRLGNGLEVVSVDEVDTIIMSGLGTHTIVGILLSNLKKLKDIDTLIIQSNTQLDFLRKKITSIGYYIECEKLVKDANIIYTIIKFKKGKKYYSRKELYFGPVLIKENSKLFNEKKKYDLMILNKIYSNVPNSHFIYKMKLKSILRLFK